MLEGLGSIGPPQAIHKRTDKEEIETVSEFL